MDKIKPIGIDTTGFRILTEVVKKTLNSFPGLDENETIRFENLEKESGICFSADNGALIISERRSITDHIKQSCQYPFFVVYRIATEREKTKINVQSFLNDLGTWLSGEPIEINGDEYKLEFPELPDGRKITKITRSNSYGLEPADDGVQDWILPVTVEYENEYDL